MHESPAISSHPVALPAALDAAVSNPATPRPSLGERIIRMERGWFTDFAWVDGRVVVRKTGATTPLNAAVFGHVLTWLRYFLVVRAVGLANLRRRRAALWLSLIHI